MNTRLQRFDFGSLRDFRNPVIHEPLPEIETLEEMEPPPPPPPPTFSEEELAAAREQAHKEGYAQGYETGIHHTTEQANAQRTAAEQVILNLGTLIGELSRKHQQLLEAEAPAMTQLILQIARKITGAILQEEPTHAVHALVSQCLPIVMAKPELTVELHPDSFEHTMDYIESLMQKNGYEGQLQFRANTGLGRYDTTLDWGTGQAQRDTEALWKEVENVLKANPFTLSDHSATP